ncbi:MAG: GtrA family protein, partial [Endozoicomonadaceae bacterium]|nr:GtrA family protein [Endozoicomonadaceae bacterium]
MKSSAHLVCLYSLFAALAIMVNIGTQMLFVSAFPFAYSVKISVLPGTCCGLITKYWLDKRYIFCFKTRGFTHDGQRFFVY